MVRKTVPLLTAPLLVLSLITVMVAGAGAKGEGAAQGQGHQQGESACAGSLSGAVSSTCWL
jgi:hypothetical protein